MNERKIELIKHTPGKEIWKKEIREKNKKTSRADNILKHGKTNRSYSIEELKISDANDEDALRLNLTEEKKKNLKKDFKLKDKDFWPGMVDKHN